MGHAPSTEQFTPFDVLYDHSAFFTPSFDNNRPSESISTDHENTHFSGFIETNVSSQLQTFTPTQSQAEIDVETWYDKSLRMLLRNPELADGIHEIIPIYDDMTILAVKFRLYGDELLRKVWYICGHIVWKELQQQRQRNDSNLMRLVCSCPDDSVVAHRDETTSMVKEKPKKCNLCITNSADAEHIIALLTEERNILKVKLLHAQQRIDQLTQNIETKRKLQDAEIDYKHVNPVPCLAIKSQDKSKAALHALSDNRHPLNSQWIVDSNAKEFLALDTRLKENMRNEKRKRLDAVLNEMQFILDSDDPKEAPGRWSCCQQQSYNGPGCIQ